MNGHRLRRLIVLVLAGLLLAACSNTDPSSTNHLGFQEGVSPVGSRLSELQTLALFLIIPGALLLGIAALVWLPGVMRGGRYRPGKSWSAAPLWFGGPPEPAAAVEVTHSDELVRGGASGSW